MKHIAFGVGVGIVGIAALSLGSGEPPIDADAPQFAKLTNETAQLRARLVQVEQQLRQQQQQQHQVEAMLRQALDATASRLESLLGDSAASALANTPEVVGDKSLGTKALSRTDQPAAVSVTPLGTPRSTPAATPADLPDAAAPIATSAAPASASAPSTQSTPPSPPALAARTTAGRGPGATAAATSDADSPAATPRTAPAEASATDLSLGAPSMVPPQRRMWLWLLLGSGASALAILAWRWGRSPAPGLPQNAAARRADPAQLVVDAGTEALWATAHELGEPQPGVLAVTHAEGTDPAPTHPSATPATPADAAPTNTAAGRRPESRRAPAEIPSAMLPGVSLVGAPLASAADATEGVAGAIPAEIPAEIPAAMPAVTPADADRPWSRQPAEQGPTRLHLVLAHAHPDARAAVALRLQIDPRVLKQPPPRVREVQGMLEIDCALVPGLPPGDLAHVRAVLQQTAAQN